MIRMKGQVSAIALIGFFLVIVIFVVGLYPGMKAAADAQTTLDPFSTAMMYLVAPGLFVAFLIGILFYLFGKSRTQEVYR